MLTGMAIGDGHIQPSGHFSIQHCLKQFEYLKFKTDLISKTLQRPINIHEGVINGYSWCKIVICHEYFRRIRKILYDDSGKKIITPALLNMLKTPMALLCWYLDDGSLTIHKKSKSELIKSRELFLSTENFNYDDNMVLARWFKNEFDVVFGVYHYKNYYRLKCNCSNAVRFFELLPNTLPSCMAYKINLRFQYKQQKIWNFI